MGDRPAKQVKKKQLAKEVTDALISTTNSSKNTEKYSKLIIWDIGMKNILEYEAERRGISVTALIKYCVAKEISK